MVFFSCSAFGEEIRFITQNIGTSFFKSQKNQIKQLNSVINYYSSDFNIFHNTFNKNSDQLKNNLEYPYFTYDENIQRRTATIVHSKLPILDEKFVSFDKNYSLWKTYGIGHVKIKKRDNQIIQLFNITMRQTKAHWWNDVFLIEKMLKRNAFEGHKILTIEFGQAPDQEMINYLTERLKIFDVVEDWVNRHQNESNQFDTGYHKNKPARTNYVFINDTLKEKIIEIYPVFDGSHDENRYLRDAGILFEIDFN